MIKSLKSIGASDLDLNKVQDAVSEVVDSIASQPMISGNIVKDILISATTKAVPHKLGRRVQGFFITKKTAAVDAFLDLTATNPAPEAFVMIKGSATATVDMYFF